MKVEWLWSRQHSVSTGPSGPRDSRSPVLGLPCPPGPVPPPADRMLVVLSLNLEPIRFLAQNQLQVSLLFVTENKKKKQKAIRQDTVDCWCNPGGGASGHPGKAGKCCAAISTRTQASPSCHLFCSPLGLHASPPPRFWKKNAKKLAAREARLFYTISSQLGVKKGDRTESESCHNGSGCFEYWMVSRAAPIS